MDLETVVRGVGERVMRGGMGGQEEGGEAEVEGVEVEGILRKAVSTSEKTSLFRQ